MKRVRLYLIFLVFLICAGGIVWRLVFLQLVNHSFYKALAKGQQNTMYFARGERGAIFLQDKYGKRYTLATNELVPFAFVSPAQVRNPEKIAKALAQTLELQEQVILSELQNKSSFFEMLKRRISQAKVQQLETLSLPGVYVGHEQGRLYPQGSLGAHVLGFTNQEGRGQYGIEGYYNDLLEGKEGLEKGLKNPARYLLNTFANASQKGQDLLLTIDYHIQRQAEELLKQAEETLHIEGGTIIVMEPHTGKILALSNTPTFDPNSYGQVTDLRLFQNSALQTIHEPGSVFKAITLAAALDAGVVTPDTIYEDKGIIHVGAKKVSNYDQRTWGKRTMTEVLQYSINTGAVFAERALGHQKFLDSIEKFGFFEPSGIDLAGEIFSRNKEFRKGYEINFTTASFGQGIEVTPLQLARAFAALANNGILPTPYVVERQETKKQQERVISAKAATQITQMLVKVVESGFAKSARIPGYEIAGKTGTAQVSWSALGIGKSGYSDKTIQSFVGWAPAFDPRFVILVKLDNPATKTAEYSAVPLFRDLAKYILDYYQIPPTPSANE